MTITMVEVCMFAGFLVNLVALLRIYKMLAIMTYQHRLMWNDFSQRKGLEVKEKE